MIFSLRDLGLSRKLKDEYTQYLLNIYKKKQRHEVNFNAVDISSNDRKSVPFNLMDSVPETAN